MLPESALSLDAAAARECVKVCPHPASNFQHTHLCFLTPFPLLFSLPTKPHPESLKRIFFH